MEDENVDLYVSVDGNADTSDDTFKEEKKTKKNGLLNWFKPRVFVIYSIVATTTSLLTFLFHDFAIMLVHGHGTVFKYQSNKHIKAINEDPKPFYMTTYDRLFQPMTRQKLL